MQHLYIHHIHVLFFFSSRRRHTRWPRDWSSDVCSSDLAGTGEAIRTLIGLQPRTARVVRAGQELEIRSEERRVGKEGRCRWAPLQWKKKWEGEEWSKGGRTTN